MGRQRLARNKLIRDDAQARLAGDDQEWRMAAGFAITAPCQGSSDEGWRNSNRTSVIIMQCFQARNHEALQRKFGHGWGFFFDVFKAFCSYYPEMFLRGQIVVVYVFSS